MDKTEKKLLKRGIFAAGLAAWYIFTGNSARFNPELRQEEPAVVQHYEEETLPEIIETLDGPLYTEDIDFDGDFEIETERYHVIKDEDFLLSRMLGWFGSFWGKVYFFDYGKSPISFGFKTPDFSRRFLIPSTRQ